MIRNLKLEEIVNINYLSTPQLNNYTELGFGLQLPAGIRVMYGTSYNNSEGKIKSALRIGVSLTGRRRER